MSPLAGRVAGGVMHPFRQRWPEWVLAITLLAQSCQLLSQHDLASNRVYRVLASLVHEWALAYAALAIGSVWIVALVLNGTFAPFRRISPWTRSAAELCACGYWAFWSVTLREATGPVTSVSYINHASLSAMAAICFLMSAQEVAVADERAACLKRRRA